MSIMRFPQLPKIQERALLEAAWEAWLAKQRAAGRRVGNLCWCKEAFFRNVGSFVSSDWRCLWRSIKPSLNRGR